MPDKTATADSSQDTMSLGDFMSVKADPEPQKSSADQTMSYESFMSEAPPESQQHNVVNPIPDNHKSTFLLDMGLRLTDGINYGFSNFNNLLGFVTGLNNFEPYRKNFVDPGQKTHQQVMELTKPENLGSKISYDFATSLGNLGVTLPIDLMTGGATKAMLAGKMLPAAETMLSALPDFALGSGWRGLVQGIQDSKNPVEGAVKGLSQAGENVAFSSLYAYSGSGLEGIRNMVGLGVASTFYEASKSGRLPSKDEMVQGASEGAAYGVLFSTLPMIREGTKILSERSALSEYQKDIDSHLSKGDFQNAMDRADEMLSDERIRPEVRSALETIISPKINTEKFSNLSENLYQRVVNRFQSIENLTAKAKSLGANIVPGEDPGLSAERYLSIGAQAQNTLEEGTFQVTSKGNVIKTGDGLKSILETYDKESPERNPAIRNKELNEYLIARRTVQDLQRPKEEGGANIATPEQTQASKEAIAKIEEKFGGNVSHLEKAASQIYDYQQRVLHLLVDSGNLSQEKFDQIIEANPNYVPFDRVLPEEDSFGLPGKRFSGAKAPIKKIQGSEKEIHDPVESMIKNTYKIMDAAARNKVWSDIYSLRNIPELGIKETDSTKNGNVVTGYVNGERKYLNVSDNLYDAMMGLNEQSSNLFVKILSKPAQWLRMGATTTPEFVLRNPIRDQWTALIQTDLGWKPFVDSGAAVADILNRSEVYNDWIRSGGSYSGFVELSRPRLAQMLNEIRGNRNVLADLNIITKIGDLSQLMEQATRVGVFKSALEKGMSSVEAAKESRESTVDFARRGSMTKDINATVAFFNAGIQGVDKTFRTIKDDPAGATAKAIASITIPSTLLYLINRNQPDYKELPRWQRDLFWMFKVNGIWFRIPKPFAYGQIFGSLPERFFEYLDSRDKSAFNKFGESLYNALSPIAGEPIDGLLPTAIKPLIENETNYSFFRKRAIVPEGKKDLLPYMQYTNYNTRTSKMLGKIFQKSPAKIENLIQGWFGGMGRYGLEASDLGMKFINTLRGQPNEPGKPLEASDIPLVKGFVAKSMEEGSSESLQNFYDNKTKVSQLYLTYGRLKKEGDKEAALQLKKDHPEMAFFNKFETASKQISGISKKIDTITKKNISDDKKRSMIQDLEMKKVAIAQKSNQALNSGRK